MENLEATKVCSKCRAPKSFSAFGNNKRSKDGKQAYCLSCQKEYYQENRKTILENSVVYRTENREEILQSKKTYRETHTEEISASRKRFRSANREKLVAADKLYYETNKEEILAEQKEKRRESPEILLFQNARLRSLEAQVPFAIEKSDIVVPDICPIFGISLEPGDGVLHAGSPTLDRIIPELGYVPGNIAVISHKANTIKNNGAAFEHRLVADWMDGNSQISFDLKKADKKHAKMLVDQARKRASRRGLPFGLAQRHIFIPSVCPVLGIPLERGKGKIQESSPTVDRTSPELGYTPENISIISCRANQIKSHGTASEHRKIADWMDSILAL